jgi:hypothetical protein
MSLNAGRICVASIAFPMDAMARRGSYSKALDTAFACWCRKAEQACTGAKPASSV